MQKMHKFCLQEKIFCAYLSPKLKHKLPSPYKKKSNVCYIDSTGSFTLAFDVNNFKAGKIQLTASAEIFHKLNKRKKAYLNNFI